MAQCAFCGQDRPLTDEHVWPAWLIRLIPEQDPKDRRIRPIGWVGPGGKRVVTPRDEGPRGVDTVVKVVCRDHCNGGWMADLEAEVIPVLTPFAKSETRDLSAKEQQLLAFWTSKTMMMVEYVEHRSRATSESQRRYLYEHRLLRRPPPLTTVWIAAYEGNPPNRAYKHAASLFTMGIEHDGEFTYSAPDVANTEQTTFIIGHVILVILSSSVPELVSATLRFGPNESKLRKIWPEPTAFRWPFAPPLDDAGIRDVAEALFRLKDVPHFGRKLEKRSD